MTFFIMCCWCRRRLGWGVEMGLVSAEYVAGIDFGVDVVEAGVVAVGDDSVAELFELAEVVDDARAEES